MLVVDNPRVRSLRWLGHLFLTDYVYNAETNLAYGYYRPVSGVSLLLDFQAWGLDPFGFHLTNVLLHALCVLVLVLVLLRLGLEARASLLCGLLFAIHPIHTESVAWISGRTDVLAFLLTGVALLLHLAGRTAGPRASGLSVLAALVFLAALLAKEMAAVLVAWIGCVELFRDPGRPRRALLAMLPYAGVLAAYLILRFGLLDIAAPGAPAGHRPSLALLSAGPTLVRYLAWMLAPLDLCAYVQNPYVTGLADLRLWGSLLVLGGLSLGLARAGRRRPEVLVLAGWLLASFLPILNLPRISGPEDMGNVMAERFCYFPSFPLLALAALAITAAWDRVRGRPGLRLGFAGLLAALTLAAAHQTAARNRDWRDEETFFRRAVVQTPTAPLLWVNLAQVHIRRGRLGEADSALRQAESLDPEAPSIPAVRAHWLVRSKRFQEALPFQEKLARELGQRSPAVLNNLAFLYRVTGQPERALPILEELLARSGSYVDPYFNLAEIAVSRGESDRARTAYRRILELEPEQIRAVEGLASIEAGQGRTREAEAIYLQALRQTPADAGLLNNLGLLRQKEGRSAGAIEAFRKAVALDPSYVRARLNLALLLRQQGDPAEATAQLEQVLRQAPDTELGRFAAAQLQALRHGEPGSRSDAPLTQEPAQGDSP